MFQGIFFWVTCQVSRAGAGSRDSRDSDWVKETFVSHKHAVHTCVLHVVYVCYLRLGSSSSRGNAEAQREEQITKQQQTERRSHQWRTCRGKREKLTLLLLLNQCQTETNHIQPQSEAQQYRVLYKSRILSHRQSLKLSLWIKMSVNST